VKAAYDGNKVTSPEQTAAALARTTLTTSLSDALVDADLLIEAVPDSYTQLQAVASDRTQYSPATLQRWCPAPVGRAYLWPGSLTQRNVQRLLATWSSR
jgi:hypothetical protein